MALLSENASLHEAMAGLGLQIDSCILAGQIKNSDHFLKIGDLLPEGTVVGFVTERGNGMHVTELHAVVFAEEKEGQPDAFNLLECQLPYIAVERDGREVMEFSCADVAEQTDGL